ncbi:SMEK domain-containing protein [Flavobacterium terrigena]|uniref:SMEK domain-containing protein n=1 Tax=Flavobacterium terrigena TaxID=402734 RepID=A0A1H6S588_9FLAO|nr:SMEK domain-containing protein [Flavobacterium terrigena]SEI63308.1 hypothetical protein SAMN05660918_1220 [Flavobacterium terrigena]
MNSRALNDRLSTNLSILKNKIEIENASNNLSLNLLLETTFLEILNLIFGYNCSNTNKRKTNFPGIDGIDDENKLMIQVTSTTSLEKIESTIKKIIEKSYYESYDRLIFVFLKDKGTIKKESKERLQKLINNKFILDFENGFIGISDVYRLLTNENNYHKINEVNELLESVFLDVNFNDNSDLIGISFDEEEIVNASYLSQIIINLGHKVVVDSNELHQKLIEMNSEFISSIVIFNPSIVRDNFKKFILIASNSHIEFTIDSSDPKSKIFSYFDEKGLRPLLLLFDEFINSIANKNYKTPRLVTSTNLNKIEHLIKEYLKPVSVLKYNFELIKKVLQSLFPAHSFRAITNEDEKYFCICNLSYKNSVINFLIFSHEYKRSEVLKQFDEKYLKGYSSNLTILVPKDYNQPTNLRLKYIKDKFKNRNEVHFLDEFLYEESLKNIRQDSFFTNEVFISPYFKIDNDFEKLEDIFEWLKNDETSVAFIIGPGGDGKTTVCQKIHDVIINDFDNNIVIFLDAQSYIEQIKQRDRVDNWRFDLQTVFEISNTEVGNLDINTFKSNFAFGNITVIIDGIDEIISTLPNFSLADFLADFTTLEETIGKGKLIINCRDIYINELLLADSEFQKKHKIFNLLKFNRDLVRKYFKKYFNNDVKKLNDSIKLLDYFYEDINGEEFIYSPFLLEIISNIVENNFDYDEIEVCFDSNILVKKNSNDYLIYKICKREIAKKENHGFTIDVDDYVRLLGLIAVEKNGIFNDDDFCYLLKKLNIDLSSERVKNSLRDNPFFYLKDKNYHFRFDFYKLFFKNNVLYSKLISNNSFDLTDTFITVISKELKYNSLLFEGLKNKIKDSEHSFEILLLKFKDLIIEIKTYNDKKPNQGYEYIKQKAISNIIIFLNEIKSKDYSATDIILKLFSDEEFNRESIISINNLYLIEIPSSLKIEIDFRNMYLTNSVIEGFSGFLNCSFNEDTFFDNTCKISNIQHSDFDIKKCSASKDNFDDYITLSDNSLYAALKLAQSGGDDVLGFLRKYFRTFLKGGRLVDNISISNLPKNILHSVDINELNTILLNHSILTSFDKSNVSIDPTKKTKVLKFINQNLTFLELNRVIKQIQKSELHGKA